MSESAVVTVLCALFAIVPPTIAAVAAWMAAKDNSAELRLIKEKLRDHIAYCHTPNNGPAQQAPPSSEQGKSTGAN